MKSKPLRNSRPRVDRCRSPIELPGDPQCGGNEYQSEKQKGNADQAKLDSKTPLFGRTHARNLTDSLGLCLGSGLGHTRQTERKHPRRSCQIALRRSVSSPSADAVKRSTFGRFCCRATERSRRIRVAAFRQVGRRRRRSTTGRSATSENVRRPADFSSGRYTSVCSAISSASSTSIPR